MFCNKCGNEIKEGEKFCAKCGNNVKKSRIKNLSIGKKVLLIMFLITLIMFIFAFGIYEYNSNNDVLDSAKEINESHSTKIIKYYFINDIQEINNIENTEIELKTKSISENYYNTLKNLIKTAKEEIKKINSEKFNEDCLIEHIILTLTEEDTEDIRMLIYAKDKEENTYFYVVNNKDEYFENELIKEGTKLIAKADKNENWIYGNNEIAMKAIYFVTIGNMNRNLVHYSDNEDLFQDIIDVKEEKKEIYGYLNNKGEKIEYITLYNINYQKELEDLDKAKNLILKELIDDKEIKFEGIGYLYFSQSKKIYVAKINSDTGDKFFTVYKEGENFQCKKLTNFYYADKTLVPQNVDIEERNILMDNCEEFRAESEIGLAAFASQDGFMGFVNAMNKVLFSKDKKILPSSFKRNSTLIRNVENDFLIDNKVYNEKFN